MPLALNPDEVMETRWIKAADLATAIAENPDTFTPWLRIYLANHADMILG